MDIAGLSARLVWVVALVASIFMPASARPMATLISHGQDEEVFVLNAPSEVLHARAFFRRHEYAKAMLALGGDTKRQDAKWIMAESLFRLGLYDGAKSIYSEIYKNAEGMIDKEKAAGRLVETDIYLGRIDAAKSRLLGFEREFHKTPGRLAYALGKLLYNTGHLTQSEDIFRKVASGDEYFVRARYIMVAINLGKVSKDESIESFNQIEKNEPIATEDYWVRDLSILAQARIYADAGQIDQAETAYARVSVTGAFGEAACTELVGLLLYHSELAQMGIDRFKDMPTGQRHEIGRQLEKSATKAIARFQKENKISWETPKLLSLIGLFLTKVRRYGDARFAYDELINHYRPIRGELQTAEKQNKIWPFFAINYDRNKNMQLTSLLNGVPNALLLGRSATNDVLALRDRIEESYQTIRQLEQQSRFLGDVLDANVIAEAKATQTDLEKIYRELAIAKQQEIATRAVRAIDGILSEAEFRRANLVSAEMNDVRRKLNVIQDFTTNNIDLFDAQLKAVDEGESP